MGVIQRTNMTHTSKSTQDRIDQIAAQEADKTRSISLTITIVFFLANICAFDRADRKVNEDAGDCSDPYADGFRIRDSSTSYQSSPSHLDCASCQGMRTQKRVFSSYIQNETRPTFLLNCCFHGLFALLRKWADLTIRALATASTQLGPLIYEVFTAQKKAYREVYILYRPQYTQGTILCVAILTLCFLYMEYIVGVEVDNSQLFPLKPAEKLWELRVRRLPEVYFEKKIKKQPVNKPFRISKPLFRESQAPLHALPVLLGCEHASHEALSSGEAKGVTYLCRPEQSGNSDFAGKGDTRTRKSLRRASDTHHACSFLKNYGDCKGIPVVIDSSSCILILSSKGGYHGGEISDKLGASYHKFPGNVKVTMPSITRHILLKRRVTDRKTPTETEKGYIILRKPVHEFEPATSVQESKRPDHALILKLRRNKYEKKSKLIECGMIISAARSTTRHCTKEGHEVEEVDCEMRRAPKALEKAGNGAADAGVSVSGRMLRKQKLEGKTLQLHEVSRMSGIKQAESDVRTFLHEVSRNSGLTKAKGNVPKFVPAQGSPFAEKGEHEVERCSNETDAEQEPSRMILGEHFGDGVRADGCDHRQSPIDIDCHAVELYKSVFCENRSEDREPRKGAAENKVINPVVFGDKRETLVSHLSRYIPDYITILSPGETLKFHIQRKDTCAEHSPFGYITFGGEDYEVIDFHFHSPAEHTVCGKRYDMELHVVCRHSRSNVIVLAIHFEGRAKRADMEAAALDFLNSVICAAAVEHQQQKQKANYLKQSLFSNWIASKTRPKTPEHLGKSTRSCDRTSLRKSLVTGYEHEKSSGDIYITEHAFKKIIFDLYSLFHRGSDKAMFRYKGSLTTPPYTENVLWFIEAEPRGVRMSQIEKIRQLMGLPEDKNEGNFRPLQNRQDRDRNRQTLHIVKQSFK